MTFNLERREYNFGTLAPGMSCLPWISRYSPPSLEHVIQTVKSFYYELTTGLLGDVMIDVIIFSCWLSFAFFK
jgi:hypothetical protein